MMKAKKIIFILLAAILSFIILTANGLTAFAADNKDYTMSSFSGMGEPGSFSSIIGIVIQFDNMQDDMVWSDLSDFNLKKDGEDIQFNPLTGFSSDISKNTTPVTSGGQTLYQSHFSLDFTTPIIEAGTYIMYFKHKGVQYETFPETIGKGAASGIHSGKCGENLTWTFNKTTGELTISGVGNMFDWSWVNPMPWKDYRSDIKTVDILDGVTSIGMQSFLDCDKLETVNISKSVQSIGVQTFRGCMNLESITVETGNSHFKDINGVLFNKDATTIIAYPAGIKNTQYVIPDSVTEIEFGVFELCPNLTKINIPVGVTLIGEQMVNGCYNLENITVEAGNPHFKSIDGVLFNKDATTIITYPPGKKGGYTIPESVKIIEYGAFMNCEYLTSIVIPNSVTSIKEIAFRFVGLTSITIPASVTSIESNAFYVCDKLKSATFEGDAPVNFGENVFFGSDGEFIIYYYEGAKNWTNPWNGYKTEKNFNGTIYGDVNGDGKVNIADLICLSRHIANIAKITNADLLKAANVNGDGTVDISDLVRLAQWIAEINTTPLGQSLE